MIKLASLILIATSVASFSAEAQDNRIAEAIAKASVTVQFYPKPWPLKNLVKPGVLTIAVTGESPPGDFVDPKTGELTGYANELFRKIAQDLGLQPEIQKLPFASTLAALKANRFDIACSGASWNAERLASDEFHLSDPINVSGTMGLTTKKTGVKNWADMKGKKVGGVQGELYLRDARNNLKEVSGVVEFPGAPESMLALQNGQVDLVSLSLNVINYALNNAPNKEDLVVIGPPLSVYPQSMCINPRETDLLKATNVLLGNYRADGTLKALYTKYGALPEVVDILKAIGY